MTSLSLEDVLAFEVLDARLRAILPDMYQESYEDVLPVSMGSVGLKYATDGRVAWNEIWGSFCDLAMAGGPPHRGTLLEPALPEEIVLHPDQYRQVADEICRGIALVTNLATEPSWSPGWVAIKCWNSAMAGWLVRAIVMENVSARHQGEMLFLPAGPEFRLAKEVKNVVTATAKTCHYWTGHIPPAQQQSIEQLFASRDSQLLEPALASEVRDQPNIYRTLTNEIVEKILQDKGLPYFSNQSSGWVGVERPTVKNAVWLMRGMVANNILARREGIILFLPVNAAADPHGQRLIASFRHLHHLSRLAH
jgi:hypothetical protein